ncbi:MAG TPA: M56 family metallopeptidase [Vicinamibacterales bacterium]|nr:M56 family metallopeptidase [Vicinamibacterales bacterium]
MTGYRSRVMVIGLAGSFIAHLCVFAVLASVDWSISTWLPRAVTNDTVTDAQGRGFDADLATGRSQSRAAGGGTGVVPRSAAIPFGPGPSFSIAAETVTRDVVMPVARRATWSAPRLAAHLWEATVIAALVGLFALLLRRSGAHLRYWLWLAASMKFFVPLSAMAALGSAIAMLMPATVMTTGTLATRSLEFIQRPYAVVTWAPPIVPPVAASTLDWIVFGAISTWLLGAVALSTMRYGMWRRVRAVLRVSTPLALPVDLPSGVRLRSAPGVLEPGVIGWRRPVLLLPAGIESRLTLAELQAVVAHEVCHIRRGDNLTAALHMLTEIVFWFHPVVWWIGGRLISERERACDEAVVAGGNEPGTYAQAIVNVCAMYAASPVACVAGVTSADLRKRIEAIVHDERPLPLVGWRKATVALTVAAALVLPIAYGALHASPRGKERISRETSDALSAEPTAFEAASIKVNTSGSPQAHDRIQGGRYTATNMPLLVLIRLAYEPSPRSRGLEPFEVTGGPSWLMSDRFDVNATAGRDVSLTEMRSMLRRLLAERFQLQAHFEKRQGYVYRMSLARPGRLGPQLRHAEADCTAVPHDPFRGVTPGEKQPCGFFGPSPTAPIGSDRAYQAMRGMTMADFAMAIYPYLGRRVIDETGLDGFFDADLEFTAEIVMPPPPSGPNPFDGRTLPSIFSVLPQQLGLKMESARAPVEILVIDRAAHPTEN